MSLRLAIQHCAPYSASVFATYALAATVGAGMAHCGNRVALTRRDAVVARALANDRASIDYRAGRRIHAALADATANFVYAALPQTIAGLTVALPYATVAYQGWTGGIVSVDGAHSSRLGSFRGAAYYLGVLLLQFLAFSLCIGAGIRFGVETYRHNQASDVGWRAWRYRPPREAAAELIWMIVVSIPAFLLASAFEFLSTWNV